MRGASPAHATLPTESFATNLFFSLKYYNFKKGRFVANLVSIAKTLWQSTSFSRFYKQKWWQAKAFLWQEFVFSLLHKKPRRI